MKLKEKIGIKPIKEVKVLCISETGWFDTQKLVNDIEKAGGMNENQYNISWPPFGNLHPENMGGFFALVEIHSIDDSSHKFLMDTGWGKEWMEQRFR